MKSIYVADQLHSHLKLLASFEKKTLSEIVEESLQLTLKKKFSDLPPELLEKAAIAGRSFDFLQDKKEDIYSEEDGEEIR